MDRVPLFDSEMCIKCLGLIMFLTTPAFCCLFVQYVYGLRGYLAFGGETILMYAWVAVSYYLLRTELNYTEEEEKYIGKTEND